VLLDSGNNHSSIRIAHSVHMKETYENMDLLLKVTQNMNGKYVQILKSEGCSEECSLATQILLFFFVNGIPEQKIIITKLRFGQCEKFHFQGKSVSEIDRYFIKIRFCYRHCTLNWGS